MFIERINNFPRPQDIGLPGAATLRFQNPDGTTSLGRKILCHVHDIAAMILQRARPTGYILAAPVLWSNALRLGFAMRLKPFTTIYAADKAWILACGVLSIKVFVATAAVFAVAFCIFRASKWFLDRNISAYEIRLENHARSLLEREDLELHHLDKAFGAISLLGTRPAISHETKRELSIRLSDGYARLGEFGKSLDMLPHSGFEWRNVVLNLIISECRQRAVIMNQAFPVVISGIINGYAIDLSDAGHVGVDKLELVQEVAKALITGWSLQLAGYRQKYDLPKTAQDGGGAREPQDAAQRHYNLLETRHILSAQLGDFLKNDDLFARLFVNISLEGLTGVNRSQALQIRESIILTNRALRGTPHFVKNDLPERIARSTGPLIRFLATEECATVRALCICQWAFTQLIPEDQALYLDHIRLYP